MEILDAEQIRAWDQYTIRNEPIASIDLMERAAAACVNWLLSRFDNKDYFKIFLKSFYRIKNRLIIQYQ